MQYSHLISKIIWGYKAKRTKIYTTNKKVLIGLVKALREHKIIDGYGFNSSKTMIIVYLSYSKYGPGYKFIRNYCTMSRSRDASIKSLMSFVKKAGPKPIFLLNTHEGIMCHKEAIRKGLGGPLILKAH